MTEQIKHELTNDEVAAEIGGIMTQAATMGFNDHEIPTFMRLMNEVKTNQIDPQEALTKARSILDQKQDYH